jgi:phosphogluconate dehydratase
MGIGEMVTAECIINAVVALLATGGSTNHTIHWVAIARAAGWQLEWADFDALSAIVPLLARVYPNGAADVNDMHAAGGTAYIFKEMLDAGLMWDTVDTVAGQGLRHFAQVPCLNNQTLRYQAASDKTLDSGVLRPASAPFQPDGGMKLLKGNLGTAVVKVSAVAPQSRNITAPCAVFESQEAVQVAFRAGALNRDVVVVLRGQGPKACGMPELHKLTPPLTILQDQGYNVALVTDGRMSGASGKVLAAIHLTPEAVDGGLIAKLQDGDMVTVNATNGELSVMLTGNELEAREALLPHKAHAGMGREMFAAFRKTVNRADQGATVLEF